MWTKQLIASLLINSKFETYYVDIFSFFRNCNNWFPRNNKRLWRFVIRNCQFITSLLTVLGYLRLNSFHMKFSGVPGSSIQILPEGQQKQQECYYFLSLVSLLEFLQDYFALNNSPLHHTTKSLSKFHFTPQCSGHSLLQNVYHVFKSDWTLTRIYISAEGT